MRRFAIRGVVGILVLAAVTALAGYAYLRRSLPAIDGSVALRGLGAPVEIVRDADAIPHIFASTKLDAFFGLGYVHAQDRLWQMEFQRRIGHGRLSEIFGAVTLPQDRFLRTVGFGRAARAAWDRLPADARRQVEAYVAGVNAFIEGHKRSRLPPEFTLLRYEPEPWTGVDVMAWVKMMAWDLSANYAIELLRHDIIAKLGSESTADLFPPYPVHGLSILPGPHRSFGSADVVQRSGSAATGQPGGLPAQSGRIRDVDDGGSRSWAAAFETGLSGGDAFVRNLLRAGARPEVLGSNNWVVDGTRTATGRPLLANDPHLGTNVPSLWYLAHMSAGDFEVIGATLPGTPAVAIGRNRFIAWGETNVAADVEDFYQERLDLSGQSAEFRGSFEPLRIISETIQVRGGAPVRVDVRISRHGPLVSDAINATNQALDRDSKRATLEPLALRWTALDDEDATIAAFLRLNGARNWHEFTDALRDFVVPSQNFVYADVEGHIGYYAPGRIPIRASGDGSVPAQGWTGDMEWTGWVRFEELPQAYDPPDHVIVTANQRPAPPPYPHLITVDYPEPYRAQRLRDLVSQRDKFKPDDFRVMQADTLSLHAQALLPLLLRHVRPESAPDKQAVELLREWDYDAGGSAAAPAIFAAWFLRLAPNLVGDELGRDLLDGYNKRFSSITRFVTRTLAAGESRWCDNVKTPRRETCDEAVTAALSEGVTTLVQKLGGEMTRWRWDHLHRAVFPHQGLDAVALLRPLLSRSVPSAGDWSTVNAAPVDADFPFEQREVPGYRQIVDLSPANDSRFLDAVGQSGHFLSPHYDDALEDWRAVRHRKMRMNREDIEQGAIGRLRLTPKK